MVPENQVVSEKRQCVSAACMRGRPGSTGNGSVTSHLNVVLQTTGKVGDNAACACSSRAPID